jgi:hypothetical protein
MRRMTDAIHAARSWGYVERRAARSQSFKLAKAKRGPADLPILPALRLLSAEAR